MPEAPATDVLRSVAHYLTAVCEAQGLHCLREPCSSLLVAVDQYPVAGGPSHGKSESGDPCAAAEIYGQLGRHGRARPKREAPSDLLFGGGRPQVPELARLIQPGC